MRTQAVIFDFDGTLADSEPVHEAAIRTVVQRLGWDCSHERFRDEFVGTSDRFCFCEIARSHGVERLDGRLDELVEQKREVFLGMLAEGRVRAHDGAFELLRGAAGCVPIAVCSGSRRDNIVPALDRFGVLDLLAAVVGADMVERAKPAPDSYRLTCELLGVTPGECVAIEDTGPGIAAAKGAGVRTIAVGHTCERARLVGADAFYESIAEIQLEDLDL